MNKLSLLFTLALLLALTSAKPDESKKKRDVSTEDDQGSMAEEDSKGVNLMEVMAECNKTFVIQSSYMEALTDSGSFPNETDRTPKCFLLCMLKKTGVVSEEGKFDPARAAVVFEEGRDGRPMEDLEAMATTCGRNRAEPCKCERSYQFMKCLMEMEIKHSEKSAQ